MRTPESVNGAPGAPFVLLEDIWQAYDLFPYKIVGVNDSLQARVVEPMRAALGLAVDELQLVSSAAINRLVENYLDHDAQFVVTMDGGTFFRRADFSFEITRATYQIGRVCHADFFRMSRAGRPLFYQQGIQANTRYEQFGRSRPIVLCDDGIGTGRSIKSILDTMADMSLTVQRIYVLINPSGLTDVGGVDVVTLVDAPKDVLWLSERDLYWGLPRSGLSLTPVDRCDTTWGVPYTADIELVESRIGLQGDAAVNFREQCLKLNAEFWQLHEEQHNRPFRVEDCPRLAFLAGLGLAGMRIVDLLESITSDQFRIGDLVSSTAATH